MLEDQGLVRADQRTERRVYHLTEAGKVELEAHAEEVAAFWARLESPATSPASQTELNFLRDEVEELIRTLRGGLRGAVERDDQEPIRRVRRAVEQCKNEVRRIIAGGPLEVN
jgi:DNA-binding PadR family transcriptional regulator